MKLPQRDVDTAAAKDTWTSDGDGLLLRTTAKGREGTVQNLQQTRQVQTGTHRRRRQALGRRYVDRRNSAGEIPACFRIARNVPSGMSPG